MLFLPVAIVDGWHTDYCNGCLLLYVTFMCAIYLKNTVLAVL